MSKQMIKITALFTVLMILSSYRGDSLEYLLSTRAVHFDFIHIIALIIIARLVWWGK